MIACGEPIRTHPRHSTTRSSEAGCDPADRPCLHRPYWVYILSMSIRHGLLALLERGPRYGYQLRTEFESRTGSTWPLNVGQVYTTVARLERDGLVVPAGEDEAGHALYAITEDGRDELKHWFASPVDRASPPRNELA